MTIRSVLLLSTLAVILPALLVPALADGWTSMTAIIVTSDDPDLEAKLAQYDEQNGLPACTIQNGCLEIAKPFGASNPTPFSGQGPAFFVEQAHMANPSAKILVVEARSTSWQDRWNAMEYAKTLPEVAKVTSVSGSKIVMQVGLVLKH